MPRAAGKISTHGEEVLFITRYLVSNVVEGRREGIADSFIDLLWKTFKLLNTEVTDWWIIKWPAKSYNNKKV
jgi:hypothetical protein